jgi:hypothetical protein
MGNLRLIWSETTAFEIYFIAASFFCQIRKRELLQDSVGSVWLRTVTEDLVENNKLL